MGYGNIIILLVGIAAVLIVFAIASRVMGGND
jgi:hypothetical protein